MDILKVTKSKTREKIFKLFFAHPEKKYYLRELERILSIPVGNIRRELLSLEKQGIFRREKEGNQVYYFLDKESLIFDELKKIVSKTIGLEGCLKKAIRGIENIKIAFIFGSFAKNQEDSFSDVDLMFIGNPDEDLLVSKIMRFESQLDREINYHIFSPRDWQQKIKERNSFLENILSQPRIFLIGNKNELSRIS